MRRKTQQSIILVLAAVLAALLAVADAAEAAELQKIVQLPPLSSVPLQLASKRTLADAKLRRRLAEVQQERKAGHLAPSEHPPVDVEVLTSLPTPAVAQAIANLGGTVTGAVPGVLAQARVPVERLPDLERVTGVRSVRTPIGLSLPPDPVSPRAPVPSSPGAAGVVGEEVAKTNAGRWHAAGMTGAGVKLGIVDFFQGVGWGRAQVAGEVPKPNGTFCRVLGTNCDVWKTFNEVHGVAVSEVVHEMAPNAQLYLATALTASDLRAAVDYFLSQGVRIVSRSLGTPYDGPGDGTGPTDSVVAYAVSKGITWFNAAGNESGSANLPGGYWRGTWSSSGGGWLRFAPGSELIPVTCEGVFSLRWSDWPLAGWLSLANVITDYDVYDYNPVTRQFQVVSDNDQTKGIAPLENFRLQGNTCSRPGETRYLAIHVNNPGTGTDGDVLELHVDGGHLWRWQNPYSAANPISDMAISGVLSVGAIDPTTGTRIGYYSSQGPTNDNRIKPDLTAASCVATFTYGLAQCFQGTSASTPAVAGAAALVLGAKLATTPAELATFLTQRAAVDRGDRGPDNVYGAGELILPTPPGAVATDVVGSRRS